MSWFVSDEPVAVELEDCRCPGSPHDHDTVWLRPELDVESALAGMLIINEGNDVATVTEKIGRLYVERGVVRWTLQGDDGELLPITRELLGKLSWDAVFPIANKAAELYSEALVRPLVAQASKSSRNGHTVPSTSPKRRSSTSRQKP